MKKIIFLTLSFLLIFLTKIYGNETEKGFRILIEDADLRPIEEFYRTKNPEFNNLLETYKVYVFKKAYPTLPNREYIIKSADNEKLRDELLSKFKESIVFAKVYSFGLEIHIENPELFPIEEKQFFLSKNQEFNKLLETYKVDFFLQDCPAVVSEWLKKIYLIKSPYQDKLKEELLSKFSKNIPLVEEAPGEPTSDYTPNDYNSYVYTPANWYNYNGNYNTASLDLIRAQEAWDITKGLLPKVKVAITDTYFEFGHEDLSFTLVGGSNNPNVDSPGHGTLVAGCVGATTDNGKGIASIGGFNTEMFVSTNRYPDEVLRLAKAGYKIINCLCFAPQFNSLNNNIL